MWQYNNTYSSELYHWGIKGQKWGVRRFQNEDGTLTPAGKKRYGAENVESMSEKSRKKYEKDSSPSKHRLGLEAQYMQRGYSKDDAARMADKRIRTEKILAVAGALTVTAAAAYVATKHIKNNADQLIKAGGTFQRIEMDGSGKLNDAFFVAANKRDKTKYAGMLGWTRKQQTGEAYLMKLGVNQDIKVAGQKNARKVFEDLYKNDSEFRNEVKKLGFASENVHGMNPAKGTGNFKKMYENFNTQLVGTNHESVPAKKFYEALKSKGYSAVQDINDMKYSGYKVQNPLIVFDKAGKISMDSISKMSDSQIKNSLVKDGARSAATSLAKLTAIGVPVAALKMRYDDAINSPNEQTTTKGR